MLSNPSPSPSGHSVDSTLTKLSEELVLPPIAKLRPLSYLQANMGAILDLGPSGLDDALGFVPLFNSALLTPTSLVSNEERRGTADSPYYVNTSPPGPGAELTAADRGPFYAEVVQERTVRTARRRIKERFHDYFHILDSFPYCTAARTREGCRSARQWLYREVMDEMDLVLADVDEVTMQLVN
ncbi:uncharacterized protein PGTG_13661 [Puccinia graminis f. sp. tritici CRL 75-36-700-3]|uniref:Uncharacterized protein n=1 Tax=Puccinia graminis f. sp. tritici (strain CRL 75-36-700-3 / race SCCL) TaxID=418459 RepID=E3KT47_PUCGT|nr:uncharacterized protein PGTG_13661 [Puccinia graminis f. sp. tritici CRL 75-36-700-3]EFP87433.1 hypothetical protein PGTG_13661 [Puccinia graminis f. sp. tritici CRL 75-36-700-3]